MTLKRGFKASGIDTTGPCSRAASDRDSGETSRLFQARRVVERSPPEAPGSEFSLAAPYPVNETDSTLQLLKISINRQSNFVPLHAMLTVENFRMAVDEQLGRGQLQPSQKIFAHHCSLPPSDRRTLANRIRRNLFKIKGRVQF